MLLLTPLIAELEQRYKGAEIDILAEGDIARDVFATCFSVRNIHCLPRRGFKHPLAFLGLLLRVRKTHYDLIIDPCIGSNFSRVLTKFLRGRYKLGFDDGPRGSGLSHAVPRAAAGRHMARRAIHLLRWQADTGPTDEGDFPALDIRLTPSERAQGLNLLRELTGSPAQAKLAVVVGIFANATGAKRYPAAWWREFIEALCESGPTIRIVELIPMHGHSMLGSTWPGYYSSDIRRMAAVMAGMDLLISADCGVMHLAVAAGVPTVGMFCVTDMAVYEPYGNGSCALLTSGRSARESAERTIDAHRGLLAGVPADGGSRTRDSATRCPDAETQLPARTPGH
ncbi:glycosyltransferase family 9 protein [Rhodanobacter ginsengisoli]|uniref:Glycosyltransferase family 9 protein n=1 Tax=Rhodanobacter ginsengisoli TaxID=418646 RepID=A0ABW0QQ67_9GAMM